MVSILGFLILLGSDAEYLLVTSLYIAFSGTHSLFSNISDEGFASWDVHFGSEALLVS